MAMQVMEGDYIPNGQGDFTTVYGAEEVLNRVLFRLTARRGGFPLLPEVGSRLYLLPRAKPSARQALAEAYVAEALAGEEGLTVDGVVCREETITVCLTWQGKALTAAVTVSESKGE